jgi:gas vesicle protein
MRSVIAFGVGAFIGAGVAMLVAPKSIEKGREA